MPPAEIIAGWKEHYVQSAGFRLNAPINWQVPPNRGADASDPNLVQNLSNPAVAYGLTPGKGASGSGASLILANTDYRPIPGEPRTQFTVFSYVSKGGTSLQVEADRVAQDYARPSGRATIDLPIGKCEEILATTGTRSGDTVRHMDYVLVNGENVYIFRFVTTYDLSVVKDVARPILETFRLIPDPK